MCAPLSDYAKNLCHQYRNGTITQAKLDKYRQIGKITQAEFDTIIDPECDCEWITPAALVADGPAAE